MQMRNFGKNYVVTETHLIITVPTLTFSSHVNFEEFLFLCTFGRIRIIMLPIHCLNFIIFILSGVTAVYINRYISLSLSFSFCLFPSFPLPICPILSFCIYRRIVAAGAEKRRGRSISFREHHVIGTMLDGLVAENLVFGSRCAPIYVYACRRSRDVARRQRENRERKRDSRRKSG